MAKNTSLICLSPIPRIFLEIKTKEWVASFIKKPQLYYILSL